MKRILTLILTLSMLAFNGAWAEPTQAEPSEPIQAEATAQPEATAEPEAAPEATAEPEVVGRLSGIKIGIDPGHQAHGNNERETIAPDSRETKPKVSSGTNGVKSGRDEYVTVLEIAFKLRDALMAEGAEVFMTRETHAVDISNQERAKMMNDLGVDLVLRIHCDSADSRSVHGIGLFVKKTGDIAAPSAKAAELILDRMVEATGAKKRSVVKSDTYTGLNWSRVPCILVECGFMSNPDEDLLLNTPDYQQKLADGMVAGICDYFGR